MPTGAIVEDDVVFACAGCLSEWTRREGWLPRNLDGSIAADVTRERSRPD